MKLRYIYLKCINESKDKDFDRLSTRITDEACFIGWYLSKAVRRLNYEMKIPTNYIDIIIKDKESVDQRVKFPVRDSVETYIPFDLNRYEREKDASDYKFYLDMIRIGLIQVNEFTPLPLKDIFQIIDGFVADGCLNEWVHKKKRFVEYDLQIILKCEFTSQYFQVRLIANSIKWKKKIVEGIVLRTEPSPFTFDGFYKDVVMIEDKIIVTTKFKSWLFFIDRERLLNGFFSIGIQGNDFFVNDVGWQTEYTETIVVDEEYQNMKYDVTN